MNFFRGVLLLILASVILSCDAPRLNPFDPSGEDYKFADFSGDVYTFEQPRAAIANVTVIWKNQNVTAFTDSLGKFFVEDVPRVNGWVRFEKTGYSKDSLFIDWKNQNTKQVGTVLLSYTFGNIDGYVNNSDQPSLPISNVRVFWKDQSVAVETEASGYYKIENVPIRGGWIYFEKEGYKTDSLLVEWKAGLKNKRVDTRNLLYNMGDLDGYVKTSDSPSQPLGKVYVRWNKLSTVSETDDQGYFKFANIPIEDGTLYFEKDGFKVDSLIVQWKDIKSKRIESFILQYSNGDLDGFVQTEDVPHQPIQRVFVLWKGLTTIVETDDQGYFKFANIPIKNGILYFKKDGFKYDSLVVAWNSGKVKRINPFYLGYTHGDLDGYIRTIDSRQPVAKALVRWGALSTIAETNDAGYFKFSGIPIESGRLYVEKVGFNKDSLDVVWTSGKTKQVEKLIEYNSGSFSGFVKTEKTPRQGIDKVKVFWKNQGILQETKSDGSYSIAGVPTNDGYVYFEKTGYSSDSLLVNWGTKNVVNNEEVYLNAIPQIDSLAIYSSVQNKFADEAKTRMTVQVKISDAENDVDSVFIQNKQLNVFVLLDYNQSTKYYQRELSVVDLKVSSIDEAIGRNFEIIVKDRLGKKFNLGSSTLKRVIRQEILTYLPKDGAVANSNPTLSWQTLLPGFNFKYYIQIWTDDLPPTLVWQSSLFSKTEITLTPTINLPKGAYFWIIWCVDDFQNQGSSKPNTFKVQ
ncbi:MAG: hypothetical protein WCZ90_03505 [Melioribacteraceae bacterium]